MGDTGVRTVHVIGLTSAAFIAGKQFGSSFTAPALLEAPAPLAAKQWKKMYTADRFIAPGFVVLSSGIFAYLASRESSTSNLIFRLYTASASLLALTIPYSLVAIEPISQKLEERASSLAQASLTDTAAESGVAQEETTHALIDRWATVNLGQFLLTGAAAVVGAWAAVSRVYYPGFKLATGADRMGH